MTDSILGAFEFHDKAYSAEACDRTLVVKPNPVLNRPGARTWAPLRTRLLWSQIAVNAAIWSFESRVGVFLTYHFTPSLHRAQYS